MPSVAESLAASPAIAGPSLDLGEGRRVALWSNAAARVRYESPRHHTISLYTEGGSDCRRVDAGLSGHPGAICVMPQGSRSDWQIGARFSFVHLYFPDTVLRSHLAETLDGAPSGLDLPERTYADDRPLALLMLRLAAAAREDAVLKGQVLISEVLAHLATRAFDRGDRRYKAGLSPATARRVTAAMRADLAAPHHLSDLAAIAGLSPFHFQRMFRARFGLSPHDWLDRARIRQAEALIARDTPLAAVATTCGYSSQSHLTRAFRRRTGLTPGAYSARLRD